MFRAQKTRLVLLFISVSALIIGYSMYNKEHVDFTTIEVIAEFEAREFNDFIKALNHKERGGIGNNVYSVSGVVSQLNSDGFALEGGVFCKVENTSSFNPAVGDKVKIKGRFLGYDEIFSEVRLDHVVSF